MASATSLICTYMFNSWGRYISTSASWNVNMRLPAQETVIVHLCDVTIPSKALSATHKCVEDMVDNELLCTILTNSIMQALLVLTRKPAVLR